MAIILKQRDHRQTTAAVLASAALVLMALTFSLQRQLHRKSGFGIQRSPVAKLTYGFKNVQRKFDREVLWQPVDMAEVLFNRDAVRTAEGSSAKIQFDDGAVLELSENSLVILERSDEKLGVQFLKGNVFARGGGQGGKAVEIQTASGKVSVGASGQTGALSLASKAGGALEVTVAEGQAQLETKTGAVALAQNERGRVTDTGVDKTKLEVWPVVPKPNATFIVRLDQGATDAVVPIEWSGTQSGRVQIAKDAKFENTVIDRVATQKTRVALKEGTYYWRVVVQSAQGTQQLSEERSFMVVGMKGSELLEPVQNQRISYVKAHPAVRFAWQALGHRTGRIDRVEVARDAQFSSLVTTLAEKDRGENFRGNSETVTDTLPSGTLYWRVVSKITGTGENGNVAVESYSQARVLKIEALTQLDVPGLTYPASGAVIGVKDAQEKVRFQWSPVLEAKAYRLRVAEDESLQKVALDLTVPTLQWEGVVPKTGKLYWSVQALMGEKAGSSEDSAFAQRRSFMLSRTGGFALKTPTMDQTIEYLNEKPSVDFVWEGISGAQSYELQLSYSKKFDQIQRSEKLSEHQWTWRSVEPAERFWRVKALDGQGGTLALSETGHFIVREAPRIAAPEKIAPASQYTVQSENKVEVQFTWKPLEGAKKYFFEAWHVSGTGKKEVVYEEELSTTQFSAKLTSGLWYWDVTAFDTVGRKGIAGQARVLEIKRPEVLPAPLLKEPEAGEKVESKSPRSVKLKWDDVEHAERYVVTLLKWNPSAGHAVPDLFSNDWNKVAEGETEKTSWSTPATLSSGVYQWKVAAIGVASGAKEKKAKVGESANSLFEIHWTGALAAPTMRTVKIESDEPDRLPASVKGGRE